jgi:type I restriction enzyme, S subunit
MYSEDLHLREWGELKDEYLGPAFIRKFEEGNILYGSRRTYLRKVVVAPFDGITSNTTFVIKANEEKIDKRLLPFIMLSEGFAQHSIRNSKGSVNPYVNWKDLAGYEFLLPGLTQQSELCELLLSALAISESDLLQMNAAEKYFVSWLNDTINSKMGWKSVPLSKIAAVQTGIAKNSSIQDEEGVVEKPYLRVANVQDGYLDLDEIKKIFVRKKDVDRFRLKEGDLLLTEGGDFDKLGRGYVWQGEVEGCLHQNHVFSVRPNQDVLNPWFLSLVTRSNYGRQYFLRCAKKTSNLASINTSQLKEFRVLVAPVEIQKEIVNEWFKLRIIIDASKNKVNTSREVKKSIINQVF